MVHLNIVFVQSQVATLGGGRKERRRKREGGRERGREREEEGEGEREGGRGREREERGEEREKRRRSEGGVSFRPKYHSYSSEVPWCKESNH